MFEKEAEEYALSHFNDTTNNHECIDDYAKIKQSYLAGAEPREKRIAELEQENERLRTRCEQVRDEGTGYMQLLEQENTELEKDRDYFSDALDKQIEATLKLDKENAELKEQQFSLRNERNTFLTQNEQYEKDLIDFNDQLTKAKEIICEYVRLANLEKEDTVAIWQLYHNAEQFLKENE